jgi:hypothetical protein
VDVVPTVLHLFGLPLAADLPGRVLEEVLGPGRRPGPPRPVLATYQTLLSRGGERPTTSSVDAEVEDRLRALGYVQ